MKLGLGINPGGECMPDFGHCAEVHRPWEHHLPLIAVIRWANRFDDSEDQTENSVEVTEKSLGPFMKFRTLLPVKFASSQRVDESKALPDL